MPVAGRPVRARQRHRARLAAAGGVLHRRLRLHVRAARSATSAPPTWTPRPACTDAHLTGAHLRLPGHGETGPTLEIFSYDDARRIIPAPGSIDRAGATSRSRSRTCRRPSRPSSPRRRPPRRDRHHARPRTAARSPGSTRRTPRATSSSCRPGRRRPRDGRVRGDCGSRPTSTGSPRSRALVREVAVGCDAPEACERRPRPGRRRGRHQRRSSTAIAAPPGWLDVTVERVDDDIVITVEDTAPTFDPIVRARARPGTSPPARRRPAAWASTSCAWRPTRSTHRPRPGGGNILTMTGARCRHRTSDRRRIDRWPWRPPSSRSTATRAGHGHRPRRRARRLELRRSHRRRSRGCTTPATRRLLLDLTGLRFMASSGLVALHSIVRIMRGRARRTTPRRAGGRSTTSATRSPVATTQTDVQLCGAAAGRPARPRPDRPRAGCSSSIPIAPRDRRVLTATPEAPRRDARDERRGAISRGLDLGPIARARSHALGDGSPGRDRGRRRPRRSPAPPPGRR